MNKDARLPNLEILTRPQFPGLRCSEILKRLHSEVHRRALRGAVSRTRGPRYANADGSATLEVLCDLFVPSSIREDTTLQDKSSIPWHNALISMMNNSWLAVFLTPRVSAVETQESKLRLPAGSWIQAIYRRRAGERGSKKSAANTGIGRLVYEGIVAFCSPGVARANDRAGASSGCRTDDAFDFCGRSSTSPGGTCEMIANSRSQINDPGERTRIAVAPPADNAMFLCQGGSILSVGIFSDLLTQRACSCQIPFTPRHVHEWLLLMITITCLPFGTLLLVQAVVLHVMHREPMK